MLTHIETGRTQSQHQVLRLLILIAATIALASCRTAMDTERFERRRPITWEIVRPNGGTVEDLGLYQHDGPPTAKLGLAALLDATTPSDTWQGVLGPDDQLGGPAHLPPPTLERRSGIVLRQLNDPGPVEARPFLHAGNCEVAAYQVVELSEAGVVEVVKKSPVLYRSTFDGSEHTADELDAIELKVAILLLPLVVLPWIINGRSFGNFEAVDYREDVVETHLIDPNLEARHVYLRPVRGQEVLWAIEYAEADDPIELWGTVVTNDSGRALIPLHEHASSLRGGVASGKSAVLSAGLPGTGNAVSMTIDLGELKFDH